jgi:hypothetical protein
LERGGSVMVHSSREGRTSMSTDSPGKERPKSKQPSRFELMERDRDAAQAKLTAHQAYLAELNPDSLKAEDARRQIRILEEELWTKTQALGEAGLPSE